MGFGKFDKEEPQVDPYGPLMCVARGCPNRWSVDAGNGRLCSRHAWSPSVEWPAITAAILNEPRHHEPQVVEKVSQEQKLEILRKLQGIFGNNDSRLWARALKEREESGEKLTQFQRQAWRDALGVRNEQH